MAGPGVMQGEEDYMEFRYIVPIHGNKQLTGSETISKCELIGLTNINDLITDPGAGFDQGSNLRTVVFATAWEWGQDSAVGANCVLGVTTSGTTVTIHDIHTGTQVRVLLMVFGD